MTDRPDATRTTGAGFARPIRVLLADDNLIARLGIAALLGTQSDIEVVAQAEDGARAVSLYRDHRPDVMIVDMRMPVLDGVSVTAAVCREDPAARVLVLTHYDGDEDIFKALKAGARGYLTKDTRGESLVEAVRTLSTGGRYVPAEIAARLAARVTQSPLSGREQQVLDRVFQGLSNRQIAESLAISERTVALHVSNMLAKLGAKSRTEAVAIALQRGLLAHR